MVARGSIDPENPPIAGLDGIAVTAGMTSQTFYDSNLKDGLGLDSASGIAVPKLGGGTYNLTLNPVLAQAALAEASGGANTSFTADSSAASAVVNINADEEISVSISDAAGRNVISAQLQPWDGPQPLALVSWNCSVHDQSATIAGVGTVLETRSIDPQGRVTRSRADGAGRTIEAYDQENNKTTFTFDASGNTLSVRDANSVGFDAVYDSLNRATSQTDTTGVITSQSYDREGNVRTQVDGKGNSTQTSFDALGRRKTVTDRRGGVTTYGNTPGGQVSALTDAENQVTLYDYNARGEKIRETYPDHVSGAAVGTAGYGIVQFSYDPAGRIRMKTDQQGDT
ncbi:MAG: hypothetical protein ACK557_18900, partial [Planctomycetota bacterium]